jgi:hypothetical protein
MRKGSRLFRADVTKNGRFFVESFAGWARVVEVEC